MDYSNFSDFEINKLVAKIHLDYEILHPFKNSKSAAVSWGDGANFHKFDPCNNASDAWAIVLDSKISIEWDVSDDAQSAWWSASDMYHDFNYTHSTNPLRAAMIVFLMMQEKENG
ncbi:phage protein NinX family protein [Pectobacterium carotovorum]|uniref:phage protein NinX family protein n=1 Tax=Pectobacterium carotovorum TaxID=554 RepID=UPI0030171343